MGLIYTNKKGGEKFYLHKKMVTLRSKREQLIYYFARVLDNKYFATLPDGYEVWENPNTGMPLIKKLSTAV